MPIVVAYCPLPIYGYCLNLTISVDYFLNDVFISEAYCLNMAISVEYFWTMWLYLKRIL